VEALIADVEAITDLFFSWTGIHHRELVRVYLMIRKEGRIAVSIDIVSELERSYMVWREETTTRSPGEFAMCAISGWYSPDT
jgi:hypothetical protein